MINLPLKQQGYTVYDATGSDFCYCPGISVEDSHERAAYIVTACNNYQARLDACESALESIAIAQETLGSSVARGVFDGAFLGVEAELRAAIAQTEEAQ